VIVATEIRLAARPIGAPRVSDFEMGTKPVREIAAGEILVRNLLLSVDPALRPRMNETSAYAGAIAIGEPIPSPAIGVVVQSKSPRFREGQHVFGMFGWRSHAIARAEDVRTIDPSRAPLSKWMSLLGLSAFAAYVGICIIARPVAGETVAISAAAGATGAIAGQLARIAGARAVGIAGGTDKCRQVVERFGFDACADYRACDFEAQLDNACPAGIDVDFENVGGRVFDAVFARMNIGGRVAICGLVSEYGDAQGFGRGPSLWPAVYKSLRIEGFRASRYFDRVPEFIEKALDWSHAGRLVHHEHITEGIANAPAAFVEMLAGKHFGKAMVAVLPRSGI
jgi:NADPH-dependent curcumin reductase CurA